MTNKDILQMSSVILNKAKELGADLVGFAAVEDLKKAPSFTFAPQMPGAGEGIGTRKNDLGLKPGEVAWPENAKTVLVIAVHHPEDKPEMDWWYGRIDPPGNRILAKIITELCNWIPEQLGFGVFHLPYHIEKGGVYLKDSAILAGFGCIGKNNLVVTPEFGPRIRLRALTLDVELPSTGPAAFNPCELCDELCRKACPQKASAEKLYSAADYGQEILPGRNGVFSRQACNNQMLIDNEVAKEQTVDGFEKPVKIIRYCRCCDVACPIGKVLR